MINELEQVMCLINFKPKSLTDINTQISKLFPLPEDYAKQDNFQAQKILDNLREIGISEMYKMTESELNWVYHIALLCDDYEFSSLKLIFSNRTNTNLYIIGWYFFQLNANEQRIKELLTIACNWMKTNRKDEYYQSFLGRIGLPLDDIYDKIVDVIKVEKSAPKEFCENYGILFDTVFWQQLMLIYMSRCDKEDFKNYENLLIQLIGTSNIEHLRSALRNLTVKFNFDELSPEITEAILGRLKLENFSEDIGISQGTLIRLRKIRFHNSLKNNYSSDSPKLAIFKVLSGYIKDVNMLTDDIISIDFGSYIVIDSKKWESYSFAYLPSLYKKLSQVFIEKGSPDHFWPAMEENSIATAHDIILEIKQANVVKLEFSSIDMLYSRDLLLSGRILIKNI